MIEADQAKALVLRCCEASREGKDRFVIQFCALSECGDYWIIRANSEDFVLRGIQGRCYVGVNAHLVSTASGEIEIVGSGQSVDEYLQDKCDAARAGTNHYVLGPDFDKSDKAGVIRLRQKLECSLQRAMQLVSPEFNCWLTGEKRLLSDAKAILHKEGVTTSIRLLENPGCAVRIDNSVWYWTALKSALNRVDTK
ncbi:hypothetical protein RAB70_03445 [Xanthomonas sontii]|uniref:hypothetical protein n=1 Tax=Xanthomonas sontii TaxID=2650745 RepID=UPI0011E75725|nr:hypothetical protein [Xanthomonas sontii]MDQ7760544.1 hypothetical protein [Xanthomonas sontii]UZK05332.1 hypothetical protein CJ027_000245 [Xanthomonas sontii]